MKKKPPQEAINNVQLSLFSQFITNDVKKVSNTIEIWESIPKYFPARKTNEKITAEGLAPPYEWDYTKKEKDHRGREETHSYKVVIQPALIKQKNGTYKAVFPAKTEEVIEEALKKILTDQPFASHNPRELETWVFFTQSKIYDELKARGCSRTRPQIREAILVMSKCNIAVFKDNVEVWNGAILQDLVTVGRKEYLEDTDARHAARLPLFISRSINRLEYRQFNYDRFMTFKSQLSRWIYKGMINRYTNASFMNDYHFTYQSLKGSGLLQQFRENDNRRKVTEALNELVSKLVLSRYTETVTEKQGNKILNIRYNVYPSPDFVSEQKAANKRFKDAREAALQAGISLVDNPLIDK